MQYKYYVCMCVRLGAWGQMLNLSIYLFDIIVHSRISQFLLIGIATLYVAIASIITRLAIVLWVERCQRTSKKIIMLPKELVPHTNLMHIHRDTHIVHEILCVAKTFVSC